MAEAERLEVAVPATVRGDFWRVRDYPSYTRRESWNGWACPYFEKSIADQIANDLEEDAKSDGSIMTLSYHAEGDLDAYDIVEEGDDDAQLPQVVGSAWGLDLMTVDGVRHVYPVGSGLWTWQEEGIHFGHAAARD